MKNPIYVLPSKIKVIGEYAPTEKNPYWRVRIANHPLFSSHELVCGGIYTRRCRVVMTSIVGRELRRNEHVHHINGDRTDDRPENLELISAASHNKHHKTGARHSANTKQRISDSLRSAYANGEKVPSVKIGTDNPSAKLTPELVRMIRTSTESAASIANRVGVSKQVVLSARNHKTWKHIA